MAVTNNKKVLLALSGGVDSSVSALLLKKAGYDVSAIWMKVTDDASPLAAETSASELGIPLVELDITDEFKKTIIDDFCLAYHNGRTPNPCVRCNRLIKFGKLVTYAKENGYDHFATGHYVRNIGGQIYKGTDPKKDQSYFLYDIDKDVIPMLLFPLGDLTKSEVRKIAEANGLSAHSRKDSLDICFIPNGDYAPLVERYYPSQAGTVL
ncbi:MAG: tRNA 2-thiouridine(34) synthase MnmA, partial [Dehalococcoidales bacterium]|nr:tRNA 2-thiouridine(34) synthase MnmA [Dehalococcoidales bacterium]